jgi:hypothetical protein
VHVDARHGDGVEEENDTLDIFTNSNLVTSLLRVKQLRVEELEVQLAAARLVVCCCFCCC